MAENSDDATLENPINSKSENSPDESIPTNETDKVIPTQETENMEVHHHAHTGHGKKTLQEYFWEFLMLFLAVFCGFLAEYQLEHTIEKERGKELAESFYNELKGDSLAIQVAIGNRKRKDAAFNYMKKYFRDSSVTRCSKAFAINFFYVFATYSPSIFEPSDAILDQLKNSGSLRYFKNRKLQELTGEISVSISNIRNRNQIEWTYTHEFIFPFFLKHSDQDWFDKITRDSSIFSVEALKKYEKSDEQFPFQFRKSDHFDNVEAINIVGLYQLTFRGSLRKQYHDYEVLNAKLLKVLRQEYKMK